MDPSTVTGGVPYFFGYLGISAAIVMANFGAAFGTAKAGVGISSMGVMRPDAIIKSVIPVIMAGILGIYGLIVAVVLNQKMTGDYTSYLGFRHMASGLCCGFTSLVI